MLSLVIHLWKGQKVSLNPAIIKQGQWAVFLWFPDFLKRLPTTSSPSQGSLPTLFKPSYRGFAMSSKLGPKMWQNFAIPRNLHNCLLEAGTVTIATASWWLGSKFHYSLVNSNLVYFTEDWGIFTFILETLHTLPAKTLKVVTVFYFVHSLVLLTVKISTYWSKAPHVIGAFLNPMLEFLQTMLDSFLKLCNNTVQLYCLLFGSVSSH